MEVLNALVLCFSACSTNVMWLWVAGLLLVKNSWLRYDLTSLKHSLGEGTDTATGYGVGRALIPGELFREQTGLWPHRMHVASSANSAWRLWARGVLTCFFQPRILPTR